MGQSTEMIRGSLNVIIDETHELMNFVSSNTIIQSALRRNLRTDVERYKENTDVASQLNFISVFREELKMFYVLGQNGLQANAQYFSFKDDDFKHTDWYREILDADDTIWYGPHTGSFACVVVNTDSYITVGTPIKDIATGESMGILLVEIDMNKIGDMLTYPNSEYGSIILVNNTNNQLYSSSDISVDTLGQIVIQEPSDANSHNLTWNKVDENYYLSLGLNNGWKIIGVVPNNMLLSSSTKISLTIGLTMLLLLGGALLLARIFATSFSKPIIEMTWLMKRVEQGDLDVSVNWQRNDEIMALAHSFNNMTLQIKELMGEVCIEQKKLRIAEFKALQAQIHPHFLYNTLDSIVWLARDGCNEDVIRMTTALTAFFRMGLSKGKEMISVRDEILHVTSYLTIQSIRYRDQFAYEIHIDDALQAVIDQCQMIKLILQPIVENAIDHGIRPVDGEGFIYIFARFEQDDIVFEVQDSGAGMPPDMVDKLNHHLQEHDNASGIYGLKNVDGRIKIMYGEQYGLQFASEMDMGTTVKIRIPKIKEDMINVKNRYS